MGSQSAEHGGQATKVGGTGSQLAESPKLHQPAHFTLSVMAPRSCLKVLNSEFAETVRSLLPVHPTLCQLKSPLEDWLASDPLVIEVPVLEFGKEAVHNALQRLAIRARTQGPEIMLVVTPRSPTAATSRSRLPGASSSMRRSCCSTWTPSRGEHNAERPIRRWNEWMSCPFPAGRTLLL